jgi:hypothetical protein
MTSPIGGGKRIAGIKWQYWAIGGLVFAGGFWYVYRRYSSQAAAAQTDPTADPNAFTGLDNSLPGGVSPSLGFQDAATGATISATGVAGQVVTAPSTNFEWGQMALARLTQAGFDSVTSAIALGVYVNGGNLSADQLAIVQAALNLTGPTPQPVPAPHTAPPAGPPAPPTPKTPAPVPLHAPQVFVSARTKTSITIHWTPVPNAAFYLVLGAAYPKLVTGTSATFRPGLYNHIRAYPSNYSHTTFVPTKTGPYSVSPSSNTFK